LFLRKLEGFNTFSAGKIYLQDLSEPLIYHHSTTPKLASWLC